jgi:tetratricopeptide (TPR) repeat protein
MKKKNKPENSNSGYLLLIVGLFFGAVIISIFLLYTNTYEFRSLDTAKKLLRDHKTSKATALLENVKLQIKNKNPELNFLLFYAYIEGNKLNKAQNLLHNLDKISLDDMNYFQKIINKLNLQGEDHMVYELLQKSQELNLTEDFFINISEQKKSIIDESSIIELGIKYLHHDQTAVNNLKSHLIRRLLEVEAYLEEDNSSARAIKYLEKAQKLAIQIQDESFEAEIHYRLGLAYKNAKDFEKAKEHLTLSAKLGNKYAEKLLN